VARNGSGSATSRAMCRNGCGCDDPVLGPLMTTLALLTVVLSLLLPVLSAHVLCSGRQSGRVGAIAVGCIGHQGRHHGTQGCAV
jgi:hypothetical protein